MSVKRALPYLAAALVLLAGLALSVQIGHLDMDRRVSDERSGVVSELATIRARLEGVIKATFSSTDGLVHLIALQGGLPQALFDGMAEQAIGKNSHIRNITLAPDDQVAQVFPLAGNEAVIGFRYIDRPEQYKTVQLAREQGESLLAGPVNLVQGGRGLIHRSPVFSRQHTRDAPPHYWGTASIVANVDQMLAVGGLDSRHDTLRVALRGKDGKGGEGELITGDADLFSQNPVLATVVIPGGTWQLAAVPRQGWLDSGLQQSSYFFVGVLNTLLLASITGLLVAYGQHLRRSNAELAREIAARQHMEAALRDEKQRFHQLFEFLPDPVWVLEGGCFVDCNQATVTVLGYADKSDLLHKHPAMISPEIQPDGESSLAKADRMIAQTRAHGVHRFEWEQLRANGEHFPAEITLRVITLAGREALYAIMRDISERKQAENKLQASEQLLKAIVDSAGAVIYVFDTEGRLLLCNSQFEHVVGHVRDKILGLRRTEFLPAAVASEHEANDRQVIASARMISFEEHTEESDGTHHYLTVKCPVIIDGQMQAVVGISTDITRRKQNEEQLRLASTVLATTIEGVMITNAQGVILSVNTAFTEITGYSAEDAVGSKPNLLRSQRQQPDFYQAMWAAIRQAGFWQGEIWNRRKNGEIYPEWLTITAILDDAGQATHYVGVFSDISSIKRSQEQLERLAHFDPLTDLPNRTLFRDRLNHTIDRAQRHKQRIAVLLIDLDGFKTVNDSLGHPAGDLLLQCVAARLKTCIRAEDTVSRLGGDEFAVVLADLGDGGDSIEVVHKIQAAINAPIDLEGVTAQVSASIGIAIFPADGDNGTELIRNADAAMYGAKESGRKAYCFYQASMTDRAHERLLQEQALRRALANEEFEVWYQPQLDLASGTLVGAEALVRWRDPERGLIPPDQFIPLAEHSGLIIPIGELILRQVCMEAQRWRAAGHDFGRVAVNVAAPQIDQGDFVAMLRQTMADTGLPPDCLEIEVTESFVMKNAATAAEQLLAIQALGITTAIDDFGTGYSSLAYLKSLPVNKLKIDRTFIDGLPEDHNDSAISRAIIAMAHSLGYRVVAEGIETLAQQKYLQAEGCDEAQGYHFSRPLPPDAFRAWLAARTPAMKT